VTSDQKFSKATSAIPIVASAGDLLLTLRVRAAPPGNTSVVERAWSSGNSELPLYRESERFRPTNEARRLKASNLHRIVLSDPLAAPSTALDAVASVDLWRWWGFLAVIFFAAFRQVDTAQIDAVSASLDQRAPARTAPGSSGASTTHLCRALVLEHDLEKACLRTWAGWIQAYRVPARRVICVTAPT
jgi:hypothetical protein